MKRTKFLLHVLALVACLMSALGASAAEAYACYTPSNTTLTFYYDGQRTSRSGTTYDLNTGDNYPAWYSDGTNANVTKVVFDSSFAGARPTTTYFWFYVMTKLTSITGMKEYLNTSEVTSMGGMFTNCSSLTSLDVSGFNTAKVTNMYMMFYQCKALTSLDLSGFNTANVTNMSRVFYKCSGLTSLDLSSFNTANVTNMFNLFYGCSGLKTIYVGSGWSTAAVTSSFYMFNGCTSLVGGMGTTYNDSNPKDKTYAHIDGGTANPGYLTEFKEEPYACYTSSNTTLTFYYDAQRASRTGTTYDLNTGTGFPSWYRDGTNASVTTVVFDSSFASARPKITYSWFRDMTKLKTITNLASLNTSMVTDMRYMFYNCSGLTSLDLSGFNTEGVYNTDGMFMACSSLSSIDLSSFNTVKVFNMDRMFYGCGNLKTIYIGTGWTTAAVTTSTNMFYNCTSLVGGKGTTYDANHVDATYAHNDGGTVNPGYFTRDPNTPVAYACYTPSNTTLTFYYDNQFASRTGTTYDLNTGNNIPDWWYDGISTSVTRVNFNSSFASARPTTTSSWFFAMWNLTTIGSGMKEYLNTSEVTDMSYMFSGCSSLTSLDVSGFNTSNVTNMEGMFQDCSKLSALSLANFNTAKVTSMYYMFKGCSSLTRLDVGGFNTEGVTNMSYMFSGCSSLTSLGLSGFNTEGVTNMSYMFHGCSGLTSLYLSSFNTAKVIKMLGMFSNCSNLKTIYAGSGWSTAAVTSSTSMFLNCTSLVGGMGTIYSSSNPTDKTYAHIDGGTSNPGYLTDKNAGLRGDVNGDGSVTISDVTALIDILLSGTPAPQSADCNMDITVTISDVTALIDYLLSGRWPDDHEWVDLGLPSGTLWATCNVGADSPEQYGDYFAWGETAPKDNYDWSNYKWCNGSDTTMTKYCNNSSYGYNGFVDNKTELDPENDAAYANWGPSWRMPTTEQLRELYYNCSSVWTTQNGVNGCLFTGPNGNTLFLPAAGYRWNESLNFVGSNGYYWSRTLNSGGPSSAYFFYFSSGNVYATFGSRPAGSAVRAVRVSQN